jgi:hypothetical protein
VDRIGLRGDRLRSGLSSREKIYAIQGYEEQAAEDDDV